MADLRAITDFVGTGELEYLTFKYDNTIVYDKTKDGDSAQWKLAVTMTGNGQVGLAADGDAVVGQLAHVDSDGLCSVLVEGGCLFAIGDSSTPTATAGSRIVGATLSAAKGYVRDVKTDTAAHVANGRHVILDATDTGNIQVMLSLT